MVGRPPTVGRGASADLPRRRRHPGRGRRRAERLAVGVGRRGPRLRGQRLTLCTARLAAGPTREPGPSASTRWAGTCSTPAAPGGTRPPARSASRRSPPGAVAACQEVAAAHGWVLETYSWDDYVVDSDDPLAVQHAALLALPHRRRPVTRPAPTRWCGCSSWSTGPTSTPPSPPRPPGTSASAATSPVMPRRRVRLDHRRGRVQGRRHRRGGRRPRRPDVRRDDGGRRPQRPARHRGGRLGRRHGQRRARGDRRGPAARGRRRGRRRGPGHRRLGLARGR